MERCIVAVAFLKKPLSAKFDHTKTVTKLKGKKGTKQCKVLICTAA